MAPPAEDVGAEGPLPLALGGGVERLLQRPVQGGGARAPLPGGGEHLDLLRRDAHVLGQAGPTQLHNGVHRLGRVPPAQVEKVLGPVFQIGRRPPVDPVGVHDNGALPGLAENLGEGDGRHHAAPDQVVQHVPRPHRGQLIRVAHQHQPAVPPQRRQQRRHQGYVHHGRLVYNDRVRLQGVVLVFGKGKLSRIGVQLGLQQPVDGGGVRPARRWSCRCPARR